jgi:hypothetical protein
VTDQLRYRGLEMDDDLPFQRRQWRVQRVARLLFALVPIAAVLGLFGDGPLSTTTRGQLSDPVTVSYERFARRHASTRLEFRLRRDSLSAGEARLAVSPSYLERVHLDAITPQPVRIESSTSRVLMVFAVAPGSDAASIALRVKPDEWGRLEGDFGAVDGVPYHVVQYVFP